MTKIEWTDETWNPISGCSHVSSGCKNCYAEVIARRFWKGRDFGDVRCHPERLDIPLHWKKPRRIFVNSMSDLFHDAVPFEFIACVFAIMALMDQHTFQVLTKRPVRMVEFMSWLGDGEDAYLKMCREFAESAYRDKMESRGNAALLLLPTRIKWPLPHVWLGVSVENQPTADKRVSLLRQTPAAVRFVSYEPALGPILLGPCGAVELYRPGYKDLSVPVDLTKYFPPVKARGNIDWLLVGGESGPKARPCDVEWIRSAVEQGKAACVPVFCKQLGSNIVAKPDDFPSAHQRWISSNGIQSGPCLRDRKGGDPSEWPADLRVREFPK